MSGFQGISQDLTPTMQLEAHKVANFHVYAIYRCASPLTEILLSQEQEV